MRAGGSGYSTEMDPRHDPDQADPTNQSGRPFIATIAPVLLILALALLVLVYFLAK